jgi:TolB protein
MIAYAVGNIFTIHTDGSHRRKLTTTGGYGPVWSPDGTMIAFQRDDGIALMDATGGEQRALVDGRNPAWAPDGHRMSYACREGYDEHDGSEFNDLCLLDLRNGTETVVVSHTDDWLRADGSSWSPDGTWIAFTRTSVEGDDYTHERQLFRVKADGTELTAIPNTDPLAASPAWSPDGATIMYTESYDGRGGEYSGDLWSVRPDGSDRTRITWSEGREGTPSWSSDGRRVAMDGYGALYPNKQGIWTINPDGTDGELVVRNGFGPSWRPGFSATPAPPTRPKPASGPRIAYVASTDAGFDLFTVRPDGSRIRQLTSSGRVVEPVWSPDHSRIAYGDEVRQETAAVLRVMDVRSGRTQRLARFFDPSFGGVAWSPDGDRLTWGTSRGLVVLDVRTGERRSIPVQASGYALLRDPTWSPDGTRIAFTLEDEFGNWDIVIVPARGGEIRTVTRMRGRERHLDWSPDGRRILFSHQRSLWHEGEVDLMSVRPDGTGLRRVVRTPELDLAPAWAPDGLRVALYSDGPRPFGATPRPGLWTVGAGGRAAQLVVRDRSIAYVDW